VARELVHGTCVAFGPRAALIRGRPGSGKSDLALRFLALPMEGGDLPLLIADDQVWVEVRDGNAVASAPGTIAGQIEVRGLGITEAPSAPSAPIKLVCDLVGMDGVPRIRPDPWERTEIAGVAIPMLRLWAFEASAPLKLKMALLQVPEP